MIMEHLIGRIPLWKLRTNLLKLMEAELLDIYGRRNSALFGLPSSLAPKGISINT
jgi:hypothetical protein